MPDPRECRTDDQLRDRADHDLAHRGRDPQTDRQQGPEQRQSQPECSQSVDVGHAPFSVPAVDGSLLCARSIDIVNVATRRRDAAVEQVEC